MMCQIQILTQRAGGNVIKKSRHLMCFIVERNVTNGQSCLLDRKWLVCDFAGAVVNERQLQAAKCWRANFIFDSSDLHKLLVLQKHTAGFLLNLQLHITTENSNWHMQTGELKQELAFYVFLRTHHQLGNFYDLYFVCSSSYPELHSLPGLLF